METEITAFSGGSGAGKTTLLLVLDGMVCSNSKTIKVMSSLCTRELREAGEAFRCSIPKTDFEYQSKKGKFAQEIRFGDQYYALCRADIDEALLRGELVAVDVVAEGIRQLQINYSVKAVYLFARPKALLHRLVARNKPDELRFRLEHSATALKEAMECGLYSLFLDNSEDFSRTLEKTVEFLAGEPVQSDPISFDSYWKELQEVFSLVDENGGIVDEKHKKIF